MQIFPCLLLTKPRDSIIHASAAAAGADAAAAAAASLSAAPWQPLCPLAFLLLAHAAPHVLPALVLDHQSSPFCPSVNPTAIPISLITADGRPADPYFSPQAPCSCPNALLGSSVALSNSATAANGSGPTS